LRPSLPAATTRLDFVDRRAIASRSCTPARIDRHASAKSNICSTDHESKHSDPSGIHVSSSPLAATLFHYIIVRSDIPLGLACAQIAHAAGESGPAVPGTHAVILAASPEELHALAQRLEDARIAFAPVIESDAPYLNVLLAIGIPPCPRERVRRFVSSLPLFGKEAKR
jgi:hypothetical protein